MLLTKAARGIATRFGYEIVRRPFIRPEATHAPWETDAEFLRAYEQVRGNTMVDIYRLHELWTLLEQVAHVPGDIIEVGVWRGGSGALLAHRAQQLGFHAMVYLCDTFRGMVKTSDRDPLYRGGELSDTSAATVRDLARRMRLPNVRVVEGIFPDETEAQVPSATIRLCHIDVDVYRSAEDVLEWAWPRMPVGALVVYDDYGFPTCAGVTEHVDAQRGLSDRIVIHNLNGHAIVVKTHSSR